MSWSFYAGIACSFVGVVTTLRLISTWQHRGSQLSFYKSRYKIRDLQLDSTLTLYETLAKSSSELKAEYEAVLSENLAQSEKIGEMEIELSLANGRIQQMTECFLQSQDMVRELEAELDAIFAVGGSDD